MKKATILALVATMVLSLPVSSMAAGSHSVAVSANVVGTCRFVNAGSAHTFGNLPFDGAGNATGTTLNTTTTFWCTNGASYTITDDDGLNETGVNANRMASDTVVPVEFIAYTLSYNPASGTGNGPGNPITLTLTGTVGATYTNNSPDSYSDTVTLSITP